MATSQAEMCRHFLPVLREKGTRIKKNGMRLARPARPDEEVLTIVNGEVVARTKATEGGSMVIRQESADHEFYLLGPEKFAKNYDLPGVDITEAGPSFDQLRQRNFKYYRRKGELLLYQVTEEDMSFVPTGKFEVAFSSSPVPLCAGDYLVTALPVLSEIWVSKHSVIYEDGGKVSQSQGARSQAEMVEHFIPVLREKGRILERRGKRLARPAVKGEEVLTIVNGEIMGRTVVTDDSSMVVRQESADHELYVLSEEKFQGHYEETAGDVEMETGYKEFRERGFKPYWRKGKVLIYEITEEDMTFLPGGKFYTAFSPIPVSIRPGCLLITDFASCNEIWMSRNAGVYNDDGQFQGPGVRSQEEMREHFLPLMRQRGMKLRRAGRRLARPARRGEEVLTIINGEVVAKTVVLDDNSMVVQEESVDREVYVLDGPSFEETYRPSGAELTKKGPEYDVLRARGFKIYEKTAGMFLVYKVTEDDMNFVSKGKFQVPFSIVPQPLRPGDYLVTRLPEKKVVYMSRNVEQVFLSRENLEVHFAFASPLTYNPLCIDGELEGLRTAGVVVRLSCATRENLRGLKVLLSRSNATVLHVSCHTALMPSSKEVMSILEDFRGGGHLVPPEAFADLLIGSGDAAPQLLVVLSCHSEALAVTSLARGVKRCVAVRAESSLLDLAARDFTLTFYAELRTHWNVQRAFHIALETMRASREPAVREEAEKLVLLPEGAPEFELGDQALHVLGLQEELPAELDKTIAVRVPFDAGEEPSGSASVSSLFDPRLLERLCDLPCASRGRFVSQALAGFSNYRVLKVSGDPGDLQDFAAVLTHFACFPGGRLFPGGALVVKPFEADHDVLSQQQMCEIFLPLMRLHGTVVQKIGRRLARPAHKGEEVQTIINGETVAKTLVSDDTSYVIQQNSVDRELYVLSQEKFERNYELPGVEIVEKGPEADLMRERGYMYYERKGKVLIYKVTEDDLLKVPGGKFQVAFSSTPQPVRTGDYLATGYPESTEVFLSRNAEQIYLSQIIRSQEEMCRHFLPIIRKKGTVVRKAGHRLARRALRGEEVLTSIDGEIIAKAVVNDENSMVIMADTSDREWYVLDDASFAESYETPGLEIAEEGPDFQVLRERGFKYYKRRGMARIYQVSEGDLEFLPSRKFWGKGTIPLPLRPGDYLVTRYPDGGEIYLSRHGEEVFEPVGPEELVRSQEEMCERFLPLLRGLRVLRKGFSYARPGQAGEVIRTIVDGEQVAKTIVAPGHMVVRMETTDRELQVYSASDFARDFHGPGEELEESNPELQALQSRGYKCFQHQGTALLYQVTEEDVEDFVPGRRFQVPGSLVPSPLRAGDYLEARFPEPSCIFMNRNAQQMYGYGLLPRVVVRNALETTAELVAWGKIPEAQAQVALNSKFRISAETSIERSEPALEASLSPPPPSAVDRSSSAPELASQGSRLDYVNRLRREVAGLRHSDTLPDEEELRCTRSLDEALRTAAAKQMSLVQRWYQTEAALGEPQIASARGEGDDLGAADAAVASWLRMVPQGRGLIVLQDGFEYMSRDGPRRLLARLLTRYKGLHVLVTLSKKTGEAPAWEDRPLPLLSPGVSELARVVPVEKLSDQEAAKVFVSMLLRRGQDRLLQGLSKEQAVEVLQEEKLLRNCKGQLAEVLSVVDAVIAAQKPLFLRPTSGS